MKDSVDGSHDVFVQSIRTGEPLAGVEVDMLGKNGLPISRARPTPTAAPASRPSRISPARRRRRCTCRSDRWRLLVPAIRTRRPQLNLSRFDTGGIYTQGEPGSLQAYLFSDRGIYRPGDDIHVGVVVKQMDWKPLPDGLPLEMVVTDPRGVQIRSRTIKFSSAGFEDFSTATRAGFSDRLLRFLALHRAR